jgi:hypothetical protein
MSDYGSGDAELMIGLYALRTFVIRTFAFAEDDAPDLAEGLTDDDKVKRPRLSSVAISGAHWKDGCCLARCTRNPEHEAPADQCACGIYAANTVAALMAQYEKQASNLIAVIATQGLTVRGETGLRTSAARIVAYWIGNPDLDGSSLEAQVCKTDAPGARRYYDLDLMTKLYQLT